ncbi:uncharacterized protein LOC127498597 isoform X2 [Ctenopharyngodon idella]|uniref:uncharacterized protein LOC127498597 isoform X2 n=1 Tax=Ctenopharyngodon idella TaxID=7959 RepID=UPI00222F5D26|nr:uncharacterized protein LOC127498597 isoform X2 [Ctenopharyngodon idella]
MDESSFETFEEELGKPLQDVPPTKPIRQVRTGSRAEMYAQRRVREEAPIIQQVPKMIPREHPVSSATSLRKALSIQNLTQIETPWEGVTLNRCLIVAITILLLSSGLQRIHEAVRGRKDVSEEITALHERHALVKRGKITIHEPDTSLWDMLFWWMDDDDEGSGKRRVSRGLRHRPLPNPRLLKKRETKFPERRGRGKRQVDEIKERLTRQKEKEMKVKKKVEEEKEEDIEKVKKLKKPAKESKQKPVKE